MSEHQGNIADLTPEQKRALLADLLKEKARRQKTTVPASAGQRALWFIQQSAPHNFAYHVSFSVRVRSHLDVSQLQKAIQAIVNRHATLRTVYAMQEGQLAQEISAYQDADFQQIDAAGWDDARLYEQVLQSDHQPFNLETGPVIRWRLFTRAADDHILLITAHHISIDAWSLWMVLEDLRQGLQAQAEGKPVALAPEPEPYAGWAEWQAQMLAGSEGEELRSFWTEQLSGSLPVLNLPYDYPHPVIPTLRGDSVTISLTAEETKKIKALAQAQGVTLYMLLLAAYQVLLYRYSGQDDILVGMPTSGRNHPEYQATVGYFVNPVVVRGSVNPAERFSDHLNRVRGTVVNALSHQDYPFVRLVEQLRVRYDPSRSPVFQTTFNLLSLQRTREVSALVLHHDNNETVEFGGLRLESYFFPQEEGQFELSLQALDAGEVLSLTLRYQSDLFRRETVERLLRSFERLLRHMIEEPDATIAGLEILPEEERRRLVVDWNQTQATYPQDVLLHQPFEDQAARTPEAVAVEFEDQTLTYAQLNARANQMAHYLIAAGIQPGTMVGICMERSLEMVIAIYGTLKAGAAYVPIEPTYPANRIAWMVEDSQVPLLLVQEAGLDTLPETGARVVAVDAEWARIARMPDTNPSITLSPDSQAYMIYTSGSTGLPKGAMVSHRAIVNQLYWVLEAFPLTKDDVVIQKAPFTFDASLWEFNTPLYTGAKLLVIQPGGHQDGNYMVQIMQEKKVTSLKLVPSLLQLLLETPGFEDCTSLRYVFSGGEALPMSLVRSFCAMQNAQLFNLYGPTETAVDVTWWPCDPNHPGNMALMGRPVANTQAYILDENLQPVPVGVTGELHIGGVQVGMGYHNRPDMTEARFIPDPFSQEPGARLYKTGDLVRYRPDGMIEYLGRKDSQVKIRGYRIELGEIEALLGEHPRIQQAVVTVREDNPGDKRLAAYLVVNEPPPTARELRSFLKDQLPSYMVPTYFTVMDAFPLTSSGKVNRLALPAPEHSSAEAQKNLQPPVTPTETALVEIWKDLLKVQEINLFDNFFDLGGHSLLAMRLVAHVKEKYGQRLEPAYLRIETLGQLAARLDAMQQMAA